MAHFDETFYILSTLYKITSEDKSNMIEDVVDFMLEDIEKYNDTIHDLNNKISKIQRRLFKIGSGIKKGKECDSLLFKDIAYKTKKSLDGGRYLYDYKRDRYLPSQEHNDYSGFFKINKQYRTTPQYKDDAILIQNQRDKVNVVLDNNFSCSGSFIVLSPKRDLNILFLYFLLVLYKDTIGNVAVKKHTHHGNYYYYDNILISLLNKMPIYLPSSTVQKEIIFLIKEISKITETIAGVENSKQNIMRLLEE